MDWLFVKGSFLSGEELSLDVLSDLVVVYEDDYYVIFLVLDVDMLKYLMEVNGVS